MGETDGNLYLSLTINSVSSEGILCLKDTKHKLWGHNLKSRRCQGHEIYDDLRTLEMCSIFAVFKVINGRINQYIVKTDRSQWRFGVY